MVLRPQNVFSSLTSKCNISRFNYKKWRLYSSITCDHQGYDTDINLYNSVSKRKERFFTNRKNVVSWYSCGPTVYDFAHVGNFRSYMNFDIIRRIMTNHYGLNVVMVMNITDIDDKIISRSKELKIETKSLTEIYERQFFNDLKRLNILPPDIIGRVTDHMDDIIQFISSLVDSGYGYISSDGSVYFSVQKFPHYGKFQDSQDEFTISEGKENYQDFALWKSCKPGEPYWESPWGRGRPGWHIECSAIACKFLGNSIDLHSGGVDLKFPHHENEEAQCCARHGLSKWVNYWIHSGHLYSKTNEKMSKSLKNTATIEEFLSNYSANTFRMLCLLVPYRNNMEFRSETIEQAAAVERRFYEFISEANSYLKGEGVTKGSLDEISLFKVIEETEEAIKESLSNDFDTPRVVTVLTNLISKCNSMMNTSSQVYRAGSPHCLAAVINTLQNSLQALGFSFTKKENLNYTFSEDILNTAVNFRSKIREIALNISKNESHELLDRKSKILEACDHLRDDLLRSGVDLKDRGKTTTWNHVPSHLQKAK